MIRLTRLNGEEFVLNAELIRYVEQRPDTFITLTTGESLVVRQSMDEVVRRTVEYHRQKSPWAAVDWPGMSGPPEPTNAPGAEPPASSSRCA